jgi:protein phosphatase
MMKISVMAATDIGRVRDHNEDDYVALGGKESPPGVDALLVVADGMGGHAAGEVASKMTVEGIVHSLNNQDEEASKLEGNAFGVFLGKVLEDVNQEVWQAAQEDDKRGMGTTCTLAAIRDDQLFLAHIGDSRAYLLRDGELHQISKDHSWVEDAVDQGVITREQARVHPNRNVITRAIGLEQQPQIDTSAMALADGDLLLLCSDGLNSMIPDEDIHRILKESSADAVCGDLIGAANEAGGNDNTTVVVATIGARRKTPAVTQPSAADQDTQEISKGQPWWKRLVKTILRRR